MDVDLTIMPQGKTYEDQYQGYLDVFKRIAETPPKERVRVISPPWSWVPLLAHLDCDIETPRIFFQHCMAVRGSVFGYPVGDRTAVEVLCSFRPECVDALWKCDMQWKPRRVVRYKPSPHFIVTNNGSFHRPEVLKYGEALRRYRPTKSKVLLVPCAADKPYPAPLHELCLAMLPDDYYMMNVTGVLGLIPQDLWPIMPNYDSGIPNRWRVIDTVTKYFQEFEHERIVVYLDFYSEAVSDALYLIAQSDRAEFVLPVKFYFDYVDLMKNEYVLALKKALRV